MRRGLLLALTVAVILSCAGGAAQAMVALDYIWAYQGDVAFFEEDGKIGLLERSGYTLHAAEWDAVWPFYEGLAAVRTGGKWGFVDTSGVLVVAPEWDAVLNFTEGLAAVRERCPLLEINTGAMHRAGRAMPYPAPPLLKTWFDLGGHIIFASDSHSSAAIAFGFDQAAALAQRIGFNSAQLLTLEGFQAFQL